MVSIDLKNLINKLIRNEFLMLMYVKKIMYMNVTLRLWPDDDTAIEASSCYTRDENALISVNNTIYVIIIHIVIVFILRFSYYTVHLIMYRCNMILKS